MQHPYNNPKIEKFSCSGQAATVVIADALAWAALEAVLGDDPVEAWALKAIQHEYKVAGDQTGVAFLAEFVRQPEDVEALA